MKNVKKIILTLLCVIFVGLLVYKHISTYEKTNINTDVVVESIKEDAVAEVISEKPVSYKAEIDVLRKKYKNNDIVGILEIENEDFSVPVLQSNDNDYYLNHLPNKKRSFMGSIFLDYRVNIESSKKMMIYGHNSSKYKMPFYILEKYYDLDYLNEHKYVDIKTNNKLRRYELFSIHIETSDFTYMNLKYKDKEYVKHINILKDRSMYRIDTELDKDTNILILQTCSTHKNYKNYKKKFLLLVFKEI